MSGLPPTPRRPWVVWLAALGVMAVTARAGWWQLDRAAQKLALREARQQQMLAPALGAGALPRSTAEARALEHRAARLAGRWLADRTVFLDNRSLAGRAGFFVLTPLALEDGRALLVQRGWWPRDGHDRTRLAAPAPPAGEVRLLGRVALAPARQFVLGDEGAGPIRQNLDLAAFAAETRLPLLPWLLVQLDDATAPAVEDGLSRQWPEPATDVGKHHGYAVQWFAMSALVLALLLWFRVWKPWRLRQQIP